MQTKKSILLVIKQLHQSPLVEEKTRPRVGHHLYSQYHRASMLILNI